MAQVFSMLPRQAIDHAYRVLVVEDELLMRWSIAETLAAAGHNVIEAETAAARCTASGSGRPQTW